MGHYYDYDRGFFSHPQKKCSYTDGSRYDGKCGCQCERQVDYCEEFKLLKVIGEKVVQVVSDSVDHLDCPAAEIIKIDFELAKTTDHAFTDKVVKQGVIHKKVVYCDTSGVVRCQTFEIPFTAVAEIPGVDPYCELEFQSKLILKEIDYELLCHDTLSEKVVFEVKITASTWVHRRLKPCYGNILNHIQVCR